MRTLDPVKHEEKRQEILAAAWRCLARDGYAGASTADICKEAGISPGHLYHYFANKEAIVTAITASGLQRAEALFGTMMKSANPLSGFISELERHKNGKPAKHRAAGRLILEMLVESGRNPAVAKIVQANSRRIKTLLVDFLRNGQARGQIDPGLETETAADMLLAVMDGMRTLSLRDPKTNAARNVEYLQILLARFLSPPAKNPVRKSRQPIRQLESAEA